MTFQVEQKLVVVLSRPAGFSAQHEESNLKAINIVFVTPCEQASMRPSLSERAIEIE